MIKTAITATLATTIISSIMAFTLAVPVLARSTANAQEPVEIPAKINEIKVIFAPAGSAPGTVGAADSYAVVHATVKFCRQVSADQFVVRVKNYRNYQSIVLLDAERIDCRGIATQQEIVVAVPDFEAYKPVKILNKYIVDYSR